MRSKSLNSVCLSFFFVVFFAFYKKLRGNYFNLPPLNGPKPTAWLPWITEKSISTIKKDVLLVAILDKQDATMINELNPCKTYEFYGPDHVQVFWKQKCFGNISQLETRPLIGWPTRQGPTKRSLFRRTFRGRFRYFWWVQCSLIQRGNREGIRERWKLPIFIFFLKNSLKFYNYPSQKCSFQKK